MTRPPFGKSERAPIERPIRVAVVGAAGRMGQLLSAAIEEAHDLELAFAVERNLAPLGEEARAEGEPPTRLEHAAPEELDAVIEFTTARAVPAIAREVERLGVAWVSGTTGLDEEGKAALAAAGRVAPVLSSPNFSLGIAVLRRLLERAARLLPEGWELEIVESHHGAKVDAPSGTALVLADQWVQRRPLDSGRSGSQVHGRSGRVGPRPAGEVGIHAVRLPEGAGEHRLLLGGRGESLELIHRAHDRSAFAHGALEALRWLTAQPPRLYTLDDWSLEEWMSDRHGL
ncbi:MAG: 4-hydroxy-tetrahydrodipicolinate reductase [Candidatus Eisenbacteria bacterium]|nr:4-hydroxy-tetrahydrodipicolinate reductase [Candidatus Eisenbacteria bacterium]